MLNIPEYKEYAGETKIALMDNSSLAFMHELSQRSYPSDGILSVYDLILIPKWVMEEIEDSTYRSTYVEQLQAQGYPIRWIDETKYGAFVNDEDVNLYYIVEAAVSRVSELMRFLRRKVKTEDLIDLPSAEEWMNRLYDEWPIHGRTLSTGRTLKKNAGEISLTILAEIFAWYHDGVDSLTIYTQDTDAANHLRASRNYSKKNRPLPVLSVVEDGILRGYVPFDKDWTGFSAEEYREASESVMKEPDVTVTADVKKRLDLTGYEIVRVQYFSTMQNPAMTISNGRLRFNTACLKKFENVEYVELLLNSVERCIAIRPCDKNNPNAIRWGRLKEGRWCASTLGCRGLAKTLFGIMEWDEDLRYRFRGQFLEQGDNKMMLFAFDEPEMIKVEEIVLPPKENTEEDEGETVKKKIYIFPPEWAGTFGQPITSIAQVGILRQEHYAGNWDVFRPATEIEEMNIFTAESLNELLREAEKIMEGWTDYR